MNRRSFLGLLPLAPIVGPALAKEAAADITRSLARGGAIAAAGRMAPPMAAPLKQAVEFGLSLNVDTSALDRAAAQASRIDKIMYAFRTTMERVPETTRAAVEDEYQPPDDIWTI